MSRAPAFWGVEPRVDTSVASPAVSPRSVKRRASRRTSTVIEEGSRFARSPRADHARPRQEVVEPSPVPSEPRGRQTETEREGRDDRCQDPSERPEVTDRLAAVVDHAHAEQVLAERLPCSAVPQDEVRGGHHELPAPAESLGDEIESGRELRESDGELGADRPQDDKDHEVDREGYPPPPDAPRLNACLRLVDGPPVP